MGTRPQCPKCGDTERQHALPEPTEDGQTHRCGKCGHIYALPDKTRPNGKR